MSKLHSISQIKMKFVTFISCVLALVCTSQASGSDFLRLATFNSGGKPDTTGPSTAADTVVTPSPNETCEPGAISCKDCYTINLCTKTGVKEILCPVDTFCNSTNPGCSQENTCFEGNFPTDPSFSCPSSFGIYPVFKTNSPKCNRFWICDNGVAYKYICENNQIYNPITQTCENGTVSRIKFLVSISSRNDNICNDPCVGTKYGFKPIPGNTVYSFCLGGQTEIMLQCPPGLEFIDEATKCGVPCRQEENIGIPGKCRDYIRCQKKGTGYERVPQTCPNVRTWFNEVTKRCEVLGAEKPAKCTN